jgi:hypothetical protein
MKPCAYKLWVSQLVQPHQLQAQHVRLLLALVEDGLVLRARGVVAASKPAPHVGLAHSRVGWH